MIKAWIKAFRLRTLPLAISGWLVGIALATSDSDLNLSVAIFTLVTAILLQILSNLANDYGDASSGVDTHRTGEARMVSSGLITPRAMLNAMVLFSILCLLCGSGLIFIAFPNDWQTAAIFLVLGVVGIISAIKYTVGKNPYGYAGFGDIFVFIFFGIVLVFGTYYLQIQELNVEILLPATSLGLFSVGVLNVNNIRDIESDKQSGKNSIPVRLGKARAIIYHRLLLIGGIITSLIYVYLNYSSWLNLLFVLVSLLFIKNMKAVSKVPSNKLDPYLKQMAISTLLFSILFSLGQFLA